MITVLSALAADREGSIAYVAATAVSTCISFWPCDEVHNYTSPLTLPAAKDDVTGLIWSPDAGAGAGEVTLSDGGLEATAYTGPGYTYGLHVSDGVYTLTGVIAATPTIAANEDFLLVMAAKSTSGNALRMFFGGAGLVENGIEINCSSTTMTVEVNDGGATADIATAAIAMVADTDYVFVISGDRDGNLVVNRHGPDGKKTITLAFSNVGAGNAINFIDNSRWQGIMKGTMILALPGGLPTNWEKVGLKQGRVFQSGVRKLLPELVDWT